MATKEYFYPLWLRLWHWLNALLFCILLITGLSMHYSHKGFHLIRFDKSITIHNFCAYILIASYILFVIFNLFSGNWRQYTFKKGIIKNSIIQAKYYLTGMFKKQPHPFPINKANKFNPLQRITYLHIMYLLLPLLIISGLGLLYPQIALKVFFGLKGLFFLDFLHIILAFILTLFMIGHIYMATIGKRPLSNFIAMINGWHETEED